MILVKKMPQRENVGTLVKALISSYFKYLRIEFCY